MSGSIVVDLQSGASSCSVLLILSSNSSILGSCPLVQLVGVARQHQAVCIGPSTSPIVCLTHKKLCIRNGSVVCHGVGMWMGPYQIRVPTLWGQSGNTFGRARVFVTYLGSNSKKAKMRSNYLEATMKLRSRWSNGVCLDCRRFLATAAATIAGLLS